MEAQKIIQIPIDKIIPNPNQPRKFFNQSALEELAESIKTFGVIQPIQVRELGEDIYELVAGERRLRASLLAGIEEIPCLIVTLTDQDSAVISIVENIQRENLSYFEEAESYKQLIHYYNLTQEDVAKMLGKSQSFVANKIRLLKMEPEVIDEIKENKLSERHARALLRIPDKELQLEVIEQISKKEMTVKKTEDLIKKIRDEVLTNNYEEQITPEKKARVKSFISAQIYVNTIKSAFKMVKDSKATATYEEKEKEDRVVIKITIPK